MLTAETWRTLVADAKTDLAAMSMEQRMEMQRESQMLYEGGKCPTHELARVTAFCELLAETMTANEHGDVTWTGKTQELVQVLLRKQSATSENRI
jgi:hypothetical protein